MTGTRATPRTSGVAHHIAGDGTALHTISVAGGVDSGWSVTLAAWDVDPWRVWVNLDGGESWHPIDPERRGTDYTEPTATAQAITNAIELSNGIAKAAALAASIELRGYGRTQDEAVANVVYRREISSSLSVSEPR